MRVRILGPFQLEEGGQRITIGGVRQRAVLAGLLLHANEVVPSEQLLVELWGADAPPSAVNALQAAISRLRRVLPPGRLITTDPGYTLRVFPEELDVKQFEQLVSGGRDALAAGAAAQAARTLRQALMLWQGPALADFRYEPFAQAEIARLEELRLACLEERIEADLALGSAGALIAQLRRLVGEYPVRERLRGQLMLALYRDGRQTEALEVYREFRSVLREELGLGVATQVAAALLVTAGDNPGRVRREASFAALCGASPVDASSGKQLRHRLNRGGDRQANSALWTIAMTRLAHDPRTKANAARRTTEGKTSKEIIRCLKRYIAREIYKALCRPNGQEMPSTPHTKQDLSAPALT